MIGIWYKIKPIEYFLSYFSIFPSDLRLNCGTEILEQADRKLQVASQIILAAHLKLRPQKLIKKDSQEPTMQRAEEDDHFDDGLILRALSRTVTINDEESEVFRIMIRQGLQINNHKIQ